MREATIHRVRLDNLRLALSNFSSIILRNLNNLHSYISLSGDAPPPVIETDKDAASEVRKQCLLMMCLQAPMASDLKFTLAALRIGQDYERLHELTSSLAERFSHLRKSGDATLVEEVRNVLSHIISVHASMRSTWSRDIYETEQITADPAAAALIGVINGELSRLQKHYTNFLAQGKQGIEMCADLILTCRHLQRMTQLLESLPEEMHCFEQSVDELIPILR
jgi:phosphate uptake regulator